MTEENGNLLNDFILESREHLSGLEPDLLALEALAGEVDHELINRIFRSIHSIKGASGFFNLKNINDLSHIMESLLMQVRDGRMKPTSALIDALLQGVDRLQAMVDDVEASDHFDISGDIARLTAIRDEQEKKAAAGGTAAGAKKKTAEKAKVAGDGRPATLMPNREALESSRKNGQHLYLVHLNVENDLAAKEQTSVDFAELVRSVGHLLAQTPQIDDASKPLSEGDFWIMCSSVLEKDLILMGLGVTEAALTKLDYAEELKRLPQPSAPGLPQANELAEAKSGEARPQDAENAPQAENKSGIRSDTPDTLRVNVSLLNNLMNLAGELVLGRNQLMQILATHANKIRGLNSVLQNINLVTGELQENIMFTRMQPVGSVFSKFPRVIRDLSKKLNKEITLDIKGGEVELDKSIIELLSDPLTHLIRNTADHGIEAPEERKARGKPSAGHVLLRAYHEAGLVNIEIVDDGKGIDTAVIRAKAVEKKIMSAEAAAKLSDREALTIIFLPGFSTAAKVTDVSGRGVGMDVVKTNIEKLGGTVDIESTLGRGTRVNLKLPLTLAIIPSLIIEVSQQRFAIPQISIEELVRVRAKDAHKAIERVNGASVFRLRDKLLPLVRLSDVLGITRTFVDPETGEVREDRRNRIDDRRAAGDGRGYLIDSASKTLRLETQEGASAEAAARRDISHDTRRWRAASAMTILVLKCLNNRYGLIVDKVADSEEIVVKSLSRYVKANTCYMGTTIMGDGSVAMILDAQGIANAAQLHFSDTDTASDVLKKGSLARDLLEKQSLLLFKNGSSELFAMPSELITRIEKVQISEIERIGDKEFIQYRGGSLRIVRLENYLPIAPPQTEKDYVHVIVPKLVQIPVGILATELVDVLETQIELDRGGVLSAGLFGSTIIQNNITLMIDLFGLLEQVDMRIFGVSPESLQPSGDSRILVAEDTPFFADMQRSYLESVGYQVDVARNGEEAMAMLLKNTYKAFLCDIQMPEMDGVELVKRLRGNPRTRELPIIGIISHSDTKSRSQTREAGFTDFENKIDKIALLQKIHDFINWEAA